MFQCNPTQQTFQAYLPLSLGSLVIQFTSNHYFLQSIRTWQYNLHVAVPLLNHSTSTIYKLHFYRITISILLITWVLQNIMAAIYDSSRYEAEAHRNAPHAPNALLTDLFVRTDLSLQHQVFTLQRKRSPVHNLLQLTTRIHTQHTGNHNLQNGRPHGDQHLATSQPNSQLSLQQATLQSVICIMTLFYFTPTGKDAPMTNLLFRYCMGKQGSRSVRILFFTALAYTRAVLGVVILSVCPSVCLSHAWIVTKLNDALRIFWYHTKGQSLCYSDTNSGWWTTLPSLWNLRSKWPTPSTNADFDRFPLITSHW